MGQFFRSGGSFAEKSFETCQITVLLCHGRCEFSNEQDIQEKRVNAGRALYSISCHKPSNRSLLDS